LGENTIKDNKFKRIILPVDGSDQSKKAVEKAIFIAKNMKKPILAIRIVETPKIRYNYPSAFSPVATYGPTTVQIYDKQTKQQTSLSKKLKDIARANLDDVKLIGKKEDIKIKTKMLSGHADQKIIEIAEEDDLIIMGAKGHSSFERIFIGSVSEKVLHHTKSSVMIVR
jgi:nucleotide-binding universal stress UspA family protein